MDAGQTPLPPPSQPAPVPAPSSDAVPEWLAPAPVATRPRHLTQGWRWVLGCGWATVMAGIGVVANAGFLLGNPPFWIDLIVVPFVLPVAALIAIAVDWRYALVTSFVAVAGTAAIGLIDLSDARAVGLGELLFAFVALLVTVSALAGRVKQTPT